MKTIILLAVVACVATFVAGDLVCGTSYCSKHPCTTKSSPDSCKTPAVYREHHSGQCGCCPACVTLLEKGASCKTYSKDLGETPSAICREPLKCIKGQCEAITARN